MPFFKEENKLWRNVSGQNLQLHVQTITSNIEIIAGIQFVTPEGIDTQKSEVTALVVVKIQTSPFYARKRLPLCL